MYYFCWNLFLFWLMTIDLSPFFHWPPTHAIWSREKSGALCHIWPGLASFQGLLSLDKSHCSNWCGGMFICNLCKRSWWQHKLSSGNIWLTRRPSFFSGYEWVVSTSVDYWYNLKKNYPLKTPDTSYRNFKYKLINLDWIMELKSEMLNFNSYFLKLTLDRFVGAGRSQNKVKFNFQIIHYVRRIILFGGLKAMYFCQLVLSYVLPNMHS